MSFGQISRLSTIRDHNIYQRTDQLYQPLRAALRKSTVSQNHRICQTLPRQLGRSMRSLSPAEVDVIKQNMFIPINKPLAPTNNLQRVKGKRFNAVDVKETIGEPMSENEISRVRSGFVQEIVYEVEDESRQSFNIYTSRESIPHRQSIFEAESPRRQSTFRPEPPRQSNFRPELPQRQSIIERESLPSWQNMVRESTVRMEGRPAEVRPSLNLYTSSPAKQIKHVTELPMYYNQPTGQINPNSVKSVTSLIMVPKQSTRPDDSVVRSDLGSKCYDFRASTASDKATRVSRSKKEEYKRTWKHGLRQWMLHLQLICRLEDEYKSLEMRRVPWISDFYDYFGGFGGFLYQLYLSGMSSSESPQRSPEMEEQRPRPNKIFVTNLDAETVQSKMEQELEEKFSRFGKLESVVVKKSYNNEYSFAFIEFKEGEDASNAVNELNNTSLFGKKMKVELQDNARRRKGGNETCYVCGKAGHYARNCRQNREMERRSEDSEDRHRKKSKKKKHHKHRSNSSESDDSRRRTKKHSKKVKKSKHKKSRKRSGSEESK